jgi:hypothetical protein
MESALTADRFDLEGAIQACWSTKEDLSLIYQEALEGDSTKEDLANALLGLCRLHDMRCERAFRIFEEMISSGQISWSLSAR